MVVFIYFYISITNSAAYNHTRFYDFNLYTEEIAAASGPALTFGTPPPSTGAAAASGSLFKLPSAASEQQATTAHLRLDNQHLPLLLHQLLQLRLHLVLVLLLLKAPLLLLLELSQQRAVCILQRGYQQR